MWYQQFSTKQKENENLNGGKIKLNVRLTRGQNIGKV